MSEENNHPRQRGISNEVLGERLQNYFDRSQESTESLHRHMESIDSKVETALAELRIHVNLPYHAQTQIDITRITNTLLQVERKFGEHDSQFAIIKNEQSYADGLKEGISKTNNNVMQLIMFFIGAAGPFGILVYTKFF